MRQFAVSQAGVHHGYLRRFHARPSGFRATDVIVRYSLGVSLDPDLGLGIIGEMVPPTLPHQRLSGGSDSGSWADCFGSFTTPVTVGDFNSSTMVLSTDVGALVGLLVRITFEMIVSDPFGALNMIYLDR
jgi:hypothetical protein